MQIGYDPTKAFELETLDVEECVRRCHCTVRLGVVVGGDDALQHQLGIRSATLPVIDRVGATGPLISSYYSRCVIGDKAVSICPGQTISGSNSNQPWDRAKSITVIGYQVSMILSSPTAQGIIQVGSWSLSSGADVFATTSGIGTATAKDCGCHQALASRRAARVRTSTSTRAAVAPEPIWQLSPSFTPARRPTKSEIFLRGQRTARVPVWGRLRVRVRSLGWLCGRRQTEGRSKPRCCICG